MIKPTLRLSDSPTLRLSVRFSWAPSAESFWRTRTTAPVGFAPPKARVTSATERFPAPHVAKEHPDRCNRVDLDAGASMCDGVSG
jgi:hypothetical protein